MNCQSLLEILGWECKPSGDRSILAISPVTLGDDGHHAAFYIAQPNDDTFFLTDACGAAIHASSYGVNITKARLNTLNSTFGVKRARFNDSAEITAEGSSEHLQDALWDAVKLSMSLSFNTAKWMPKFNEVKFKALVAKLLTEAVGQGRVQYSVKILGMSGHLVEFPLAVKSAVNESFFFIEPIALLENEKIDWMHVYQTIGKMTDVKQTDSTNHRIIVLEEGASQSEFGKAATILSQCAAVRTLGNPESWRDFLAAA